MSKDKPAILFLTAAANWPLTDGKRQRTWFLIEGISKEYDVDLLFIGNASEFEEVKKSNNSVRNYYFIQLIDLKFIHPSAFIFFSKDKKIKRSNFFKEFEVLYLKLQESNQYKFIFSRYVSPLIVFPKKQNIKIICDIDDVYFEAQRSRIQNETNFYVKNKVRLLFYLGSMSIKKIYSRIDLKLVVKPSDSTFPKLDDSVVIPNLPFGFFLNDGTSIQSESKIVNKSEIRIGFIGKLSYKPNYEGLIRFITSVWIPLQKTGFKGKFCIAGSGKIPKSLELAIQKTTNIELFGFVENTNDFWSIIDVLAVPVVEGGGTNIKIAEAFMYGKRVISNQFSARGYQDFVVNNYLSIADDELDWIKLCKEVAANKPLLGQEIMKFATSKYNVNTWNTLLVNAIKSIK